MFFFCDFLFVLQKKRMISEAVSKVLSGVTDLLGGFIQDIAAAEYAPEPILRRSKRRRGTNNRQTADDDEDRIGLIQTMLKTLKSKTAALKMTVQIRKMTI